MEHYYTKLLGNGKKKKKVKQNYNESPHICSYLSLLQVKTQLCFGEVCVTFEEIHQLQFLKPQVIF